MLQCGVASIAAIVGWLLAPLLTTSTKSSSPFSLLPDVAVAVLSPDASLPPSTEEHPPVSTPSIPQLTIESNRATQTPSILPPCTLPQGSPASTSFLPDPIISVVTPQPAPEDADLESYLARFPRNGDLHSEQVQPAHIAGKILFFRALYLHARVLANNLGTSDSQVSFPIPTTTAEAETKIRDYLQQTVSILTKIRPHPSYKEWSQALYFNAWALILLQRLDEAVNFLQIVGRTRSQSLYANYARLSLVLHYLKQNNPTLAAHWLVQITKIEPRHANLLAWVRLKITVVTRREDLIDTASWDTLFQLPEGEPMKTAFLELAAMWCIQENVDSDCIRRHLARLSPIARQTYLEFAAFHTPRDPKNLQAMCQLLGK